MMTWWHKMTFSRYEILIYMRQTDPQLSIYIARRVSHLCQLVCSYGSPKPYTIWRSKGVSPLLSHKYSNINSNGLKLPFYQYHSRNNLHNRSQIKSKNMMCPHRLLMRNGLLLTGKYFLVLCLLLRGCCSSCSFGG